MRSVDLRRQRSEPPSVNPWFLRYRALRGNYLRAGEHRSVAELTQSWEVVVGTHQAIVVAIESDGRTGRIESLIVLVAGFAVDCSRCRHPRGRAACARHLLGSKLGGAEVDHEVRILLVDLDVELDFTGSGDVRNALVLRAHVHAGRFIALGVRDRTTHSVLDLGVVVEKRLRLGLEVSSVGDEFVELVETCIVVAAT